MKKGNQASLKDVLKTRSHFVKVQNYVYKAREKQYGKEINTFGSIYIDSKTPFVYADGGIFQEYEIGPYAIGHPIIHIPFSVYK